MSYTSRRMIRQGRALAGLGLLGGAALLAGCGGSGSSNSASPQVRAVNALSNGGNATIFVNGTTVSGSQSYFSASGYQSLGNAASSVTFTLSGVSSGTSFPPVTANLLIGNYYSAILVGRADITAPVDPRYPSVIVTADTLTTPSSSQAELQIVQAAPDAGGVDILVNGTTVASGAAYKSVSSYFGEPSGNVTVQVSQTGSNTVLVTPQTLSLSSGHVYTIYVVEPTITPTPGYGIQDTDDTSAAGL